MILLDIAVIQAFYEFCTKCIVHCQLSNVSTTVSYLPAIWVMLGSKFTYIHISGYLGYLSLGVIMSTFYKNDFFSVFTVMEYCTI